MDHMPEFCGLFLGSVRTAAAQNWTKAAKELFLKVSMFVCIFTLQVQMNPGIKKEEVVA